MLRSSHALSNIASPRALAPPMWRVALAGHGGYTGPMPSLEKPPVVTSTVKWRFPSVHPKGQPFALGAAGIALLSLLVWKPLFWPLVGLAIWVAAFFRDPVRVTPQGDDILVAPADGLVTMIQPVAIPRELDGPNGIGDAPRIRVSIFMSVFDVHINRTPVSGTVTQVAYVSGKFLNADLDKASEENERQHLVVEDRHGRRVGFTQIAGLVARRIVGFVKPGDMVVGGQRIGLIRFGSRVDVYLPEGCTPQVVLGQRTLAGETVIGRYGAPPVGGIAQ